METVKVGNIDMLKKLVNKGVEVAAETTNRANYGIHCSVERYRALWANDYPSGGTLLQVKGWTALHEAIASKQTA